MRKSRKNKFNIDKIVKQNPAVDAEELARNLEIIEELRKRGIKVGPNYNLGSPFLRPQPQNETEKMGSTLHLASN